MSKAIAENKKAFHDYEILERFEAGLSLLGHEVKSLRAGRASIRDSFARVKGTEIFLTNCQIPPYEYMGVKERESYIPSRERKLLLHKKEIAELASKLKEKGLTLLPLKLYIKHNVVKVELGLGKGKKQYDKRDIIRKKEDIKLARNVKNKGR